MSTTTSVPTTPASKMERTAKSTPTTRGVDIYLRSIVGMSSKWKNTTLPSLPSAPALIAGMLGLLFAPMPGSPWSRMIYGNTPIAHLPAMVDGYLQGFTILAFSTWSCAVLIQRYWVALKRKAARKGETSIVRLDPLNMVLFEIFGSRISGWTCSHYMMWYCIGGFLLKFGWNFIGIAFVGVVWEILEDLCSVYTKGKKLGRKMKKHTVRKDDGSVAYQDWWAGSFQDIIVNGVGFVLPAALITLAPPSVHLLVSLVCLVQGLAHSVIGAIMLTASDFDWAMALLWSTFILGGHFVYYCYAEWFGETGYMAITPYFNWNILAAVVVPVFSSLAIFQACRKRKNM